MPLYAVISLGVPTVRAFGARAVVAADVDDQRVVELAQVLDGLDHAADLVVGVGHVGGEHLGLAGEQLLLLGGERVPLRQIVRPGRELRCSPGSRRAASGWRRSGRAARSSPCRTCP